MDTDKFTVADTTGNTSIGGTLAVIGNQTNTGDLAVNGGDITTTATSATIFNTNATTVDAFEAATTLNIGGSSGNTTIQNNLVVTGNLTINGTTTTLNTETYEVEDSLLYIATGNSGNSVDIGFAGHATISTVYQHLGLVRDATDGVWKLFSGVASEPSGSTLDFTSAVYDPLKMGALTATNGTFTAALTYGGVTLSNSVTGTGSMVLSASPTLSGTLSAAAGSFSSTLASGALTVTGAITATTSITSYYSDDRLKTRTGNIENALEKVLSLDGFHYHANETAVALGYDASKQEVGLSAQQVQAVLPEVIAPAPIDPQYMTLHYERLVPLLVEAIKEQQKQIEELKAKLGN
jgi:hypothetical protein